jgi:CDP-paratose 2-epimerase
MDGFGMPTALSWRLLAGPAHAGRTAWVSSYLMICAVKTGHIASSDKGKQVRDNIHSFDSSKHLWNSFTRRAPAKFIGGSGIVTVRCSAIDLCEEISGCKLTWSYEMNRIGDHIWWISDVRNFRNTIPIKFRYSLREILDEIHRSVAHRAE